uniref:Uncharacterized protein n=1 Tax=Marseillevirus LCMAC102 TaxID=2506603 RepID=A0A481YU36_9VIRU|nr:MAG: hypothetical protein LCMAC102_02520 [Marseillevirus LCMAC102]
MIKFVKDEYACEINCEKITRYIFKILYENPSSSTDQVFDIVQNNVAERIGPFKPELKKLICEILEAEREFAIKKNSDDTYSLTEEALNSPGVAKLMILPIPDPRLDLITIFKPKIMTVSWYEKFMGY